MKKLISLLEAKELLSESVKRSAPIKEMEVVPLECAIGRVVVKDIFAPENIPHFRQAAMDGYAFSQKEALAGPKKINEVWFEKLGVQPAQFIENEIPYKNQFSVVEIMTGASVPDWCDTVIKIEDTQLSEDKKQVKLLKIPQKGENIRSIGSDLRKGDKILSADSVVSLWNIMALAANGITELMVSKKLKVVLLSTGNEIVPIEQHILATGEVRNSSALFLKKYFENLGLEVVGQFCIPDEQKSLEAFLQNLRQMSIDLVVSTGAVSMGEYDIIGKFLSQMGGEIVFHKVAIRPGKPLLFAELSLGSKKIPFFGLPGNPMATLVGATYFISYYLRCLLNQKLESFEILSEQVLEWPKLPLGLSTFLLAREIQGDFGGLVKKRYQILEGQQSYRVFPANQANCLVLFPVDDSLKLEVIYI